MNISLASGMAALTAADKEKIKRAIPKANNKVIDATIARLYVAYPDPSQWNYTGLMGAVVLVDDTVGHTFFLKLVDITGSRGVIWDQELYVDFAYHMDRKFFHTFEIEECLVGLLFEDTNDASHFHKRVVDRKKHGSKQTVNNKSAIALKERVVPQHKGVGPRGRAESVVYYDDAPPPEWRSLYAELARAGISEDMIADNKDFIKDYIAKQGGPLVGLEPPIPRRRLQFTDPDALKRQKSKKAPPPPPPSSSLAPGPLPSTSTRPPLPPKSVSPAPSVPDPGSGEIEVEEKASPTPAKPRFRLPPATAVIPSVPTPLASPPSQPAEEVDSVSRPVTHAAPPAPPPRQENPGPPPPPRAGNPGPPPPPRAAVAAIATPPRSGAVPPPPPPRATRAAPPPPPPRAHLVATATTASAPAPASLPPRLLPQVNAMVPPPIPGGRPVTLTATPPPPPPAPAATANDVPAAGGPPPPPPLPPAASPASPTSPSGSAGGTGDQLRDALLASIRGAGVGSLKKVDKTPLEKRSVLLPENRAQSPTPASPSSNTSQPASLADALSLALNKRKEKVAKSDNEEDDDW